jgi:nitroreductase
MNKTLLLSLCLAASMAGAQTVISLPAPRKSGGMPLMEALAKRQSTRSFQKDKPIPDNLLGELLWAGFGINREDGRRTAPTAVNFQEITIFVLRKDGAWRYDAAKHALEKVEDGDLRDRTVMERMPQAFALDAPITLVYVCDDSKGRGGKGAAKWGPMDTGFIAQNVYLYCASAGLGTVVRASFDGATLAAALHLPPGESVTLCQCIGWPVTEP